ncbi:hypothetical protein [Streptomyces scabiei]|uniref:hypothetical protein n=1 Tax=Streptomyces scabiei TaxID=1930 RepID=UPI000A9E0D45|nr:hypothetical protein [Streptomyces scabiei]
MSYDPTIRAGPGNYPNSIIPSPMVRRLSLDGKARLRNWAEEDERLLPIADWLERYGATGADGMGDVLVPELVKFEKGTAAWRAGFERLTGMADALGSYIDRHPYLLKNELYTRLMMLLFRAVDARSSPRITPSR